MPWFNKNGSRLNIYDEIGLDGFTSEAFASELAAIGEGDVELHLNTPGGDVFEGVAVYNALKMHPGRVTVIVDGLAASIASVVAMAGDVIKMHETSMLMIHEPWTFRAGNAEVFRNSANLLDKVRDNSVVPAYKARIADETRIREMMAAETWINAEEALALGIIDEIIQAPAKVKAQFTRPMNAFGFKELPKAFDPRMSTDKADAIRSMAKVYGIDQEIVDRYIRNDATVEDAMVGFKALKTDREDFTVLPPLNMVQVKREEDAKRSPAIAKKLAAIGGATISAEDRKAVFADDSLPTDLHGLIREQLYRKSLLPQAKINNLTAHDLADWGLKLFQNSIPGSCGDFGNIGQDAINVAIYSGFNSGPGTWQSFTTVQPVTDYEEFYLTSASSFGDMVEILDGAPFQVSTLSDKAESGYVTAAGRSYGISYRALVNNDGEVLGRIPALMGWAWMDYLNRIIIDKLYGSAGVGPTMTEDSTAAFAASRGNLITDGGVPTVDRIAVGRKYLRNVTAPVADQSQTPRRLNLTPGVLLVPDSLQTVAEQLVFSPSNPGSSNEADTNPFAGLALVADSYLDSKNSDAWYLIAGKDQLPCMHLLALDGQVSPRVDIEQSGVNEPLGTFFRISGAVGPVLNEWRGLFLNDGVAE